MSERGRHVRRSGVGFYRDILFLVAGILIVGAIVFGGLSVWAGRGNQETVSTATTSTTSTTRPSDEATTVTTATTASPTTAPPSASPTATEVTSTTSQPTTTVREARPAGEVAVVVLNSIGVAGLAADVTDELTTLGYQTVPPDNYTPELSDTMIFHADGFALEALELTEVFPDGTVAPDPELTAAQGTDVVVVIGLSYQE